jgi:hypothetical protein
VSRDEFAATWARRIRELHPDHGVSSAAEHVGGTLPERIALRKINAQAKTLNVSRMSRRHLTLLASEAPEQAGEDYVRPRTRGECADGPRPCPFVSCRHHLFLEVEQNGSIKFNQPDVEVWEMAESCAIDIADRGSVAIDPESWVDREHATLEVVGQVLNITRERVRQLEVRALAKVKKYGRLHDFAEGRRLPLRDLQLDDDVNVTEEGDVDWDEEDDECDERE